MMGREFNGKKNNQKVHGASSRNYITHKTLVPVSMAMVEELVQDIISFGDEEKKSALPEKTADVEKQMISDKKTVNKRMLFVLGIVFCIIFLISLKMGLLQNSLYVMGLLLICLMLFITGLKYEKKSKRKQAVPDKQEILSLVLGVDKAFRTAKQWTGNGEIDALIYEVRIIREKISVESDFGHGNSSVIECENRIVLQFQNLLKLAENFLENDIKGNIREANEAIEDINLLLKMRTELKKRKK